MAKTWVLDTETKGTGANMVPYEQTLAGSRQERELALVELGGSDAPQTGGEQPQARASTRFKVVDVLTSRVLAEDAGVRETVRALEGARSVVDVRVYRWAEEPRRWRLLSLDQVKTLWTFRGRLGDAPAGGDGADEPVGATGQPATGGS
jgi:hypothetical protein